MPIGKAMLSKMWLNLGPSKFGNPFTFIWKYSSKRDPTFLDHHTKLSHCHVDATVMLMLLEPLFNCIYPWCKFFNVISVKNYWISHDLLLAFAQSYLLGIISQILGYEKYDYM